MRRLDRVIPEGTKDYIFKEMRIKRSCEQALRGLFENVGFEEVMTPTLEFFDVFSKDMGNIPQNELYTLTDSNGCLLSLRADSTKPIARMVAARLKNSEFPLKLYYNQAIFRRRNIVYNLKLDEILQMGVELLGKSFSSDSDIIVLAINCMQALFGDSFLLEIGHVGFMKPFLDELPNGIRESVKNAIIEKNYPEIKKLAETLKEKGEFLLELPYLLGNIENIGKIEKHLISQESKRAAFEIKEIWKKLVALNLQKNVVIDPTVINMQDYYTGIVFKGYVSGLGAEVLSGGRYDTLYNDYDLNIPAIGFAIDISESIRILAKNE